MTAILEASGLTKRFGRTRALAGLDLVANPGRLVALLGPNGAGKTTFTRAVTTLLRPDAGTLPVAGFDALRHLARVRQLIGLAGQYAAVEGAMTGRENLELVGRLFGLDHRRARPPPRSWTTWSSPRMPTGWSAATPAGCAPPGPGRQPGRGPRLLLLDEPTAGLDPPAASSCEMRSAGWSPPAPTCC